MIEPGPWHITAPAYEAMGDLPAKCGSGEGVIYVIEFSLGTIKVGQTANPRSRMRQHYKDALKFGGRILRMWVSDAHRQWRDNEAELIIACKRVGEAAGSTEYFRGIDYDSVITFASGLPMDESSPELALGNAYWPPTDPFDQWCRDYGALSYVLPQIAAAQGASA